MEGVKSKDGNAVSSKTETAEPLNSGKSLENVHQGLSTFPVERTELEEDEDHIFHKRHPPQNVPPVIRPDPAQSFLWGAQNLFAALNAVNARLSVIEFSKCKTDEDIRRRLESLRNFVLSVYRQLQSHNDYVRGKQFISGVEEAAANVVVTKCLPEIWKLRANLEDLSKKVNSYSVEPAVTRSKRAHHPEATLLLREEIETILLRLASLGEERVQHIEIVGNGKRYKDGISMRRIITEDQLGKGDYSQLGVPAHWKAQSDVKTINTNFKQITTMFNDILIPRLNAIEKRTETRLDQLDKRVNILQGLFATLNSRIEAFSGREATSENEAQPKEHALHENPGQTDAKILGKYNIGQMKRYSAQPGRAAFNRSKTEGKREAQFTETKEVPTEEDAEA